MVILKEKQKIPLKIKRMGINGEGIGFYQKTLIFVPGALKGEEIFCQITSVKRNFAEAKLLKINKASKNRVVPQCPIFDSCGGCQIMHLAYPQQLVFKEDVIRQALKKFKPKGYEQYQIRNTIGMDNPWHYRAKLQFQTRSFSGKVVAGLYAEGSHRLIPIDNCLVQDQSTQEIVNYITQLLDQYKVPIYNERKIEGLRTIMIRKAIANQSLQIIFITSKEVHLAPIILDMTKTYPEIKTVALNINRSKSSELYGDKTEIIWGQDTIEEEVLDYHFALSPRAFYQLNPKQTSVLYAQVVEALEVSESDHIIDAYCGVGTIGFAFAKKVKSIRGMDIIPEAIEDAKKNAQDMGFENTYYECGKAEDIIPKWYQDGYRADAIIVDPPRTGLDKKLIETIMTYQPEKMVYVSCNTSTLARDLVELSKVYTVDYIQSVDMFPHTARTEAVVKLRRK